ncbi:MAG: tyrosine-type recombinase/integrase [Firmicutes bacterium]|nr:tyrosine-type recombinase/integrase [Bacillota bacterium]
MEVVKVKTEDGKERYYVADRQGLPIEPVLKFIRFKDNTNYARNTLKMYCYHLKLYFEYLEQRGVDYQDITIDDLALFVNWLQSPAGNLKIIPINVVSQSRGVATINIIIGTVLAFYDYIHQRICRNMRRK